MEDSQKIVVFLLYSQGYMKEQCQKLIQQRERALKDQTLFSDEIERQFLDNVKHVLSTEVQKNLASNPEEVRIVLDNMNIKEYIFL